MTKNDFDFEHLSAQRHGHPCRGAIMIHLPGYGDPATFPRGASPEPRHELPDGWTPWSGGEFAPIDDGILHKVMMRDGWISPADDEASTWDWECCGDSISDVVAYRIVES